MTSVYRVFALLCVAASAVSALRGENYLNVGLSENCESSGLGSRIVNGKVAPAGAFPYMASLRKKTLNSHFCGGSIINEEWILTAAHCLTGKKSSDIMVVVGTNKLNSGGKAHGVSFITYHQNYSINGVVNDVGLIKVAEPFEFNSLALPVALANSDVDKNDHPATISGWGRFDTNSQTLPNDMQYFTTCLMSRQACSDKIGVVENDYQKICTFTHFGQGVCNGDSGSPLVADAVQIGIASYVITDCAYGYPDVFTSVYSFLDWIKDTIKSN